MTGNVVRPVRILVVDDEAVVRHLLDRALSAEGYEVLTAVDGGDGFRVAVEERPSLVLLDLMMPNLDGYEFLRRRRDEPILKDTPVVVLTAYGGEQEVVQAIAEGADDFLVKPVSLIELAARLRARLRDRETVADLRGQRRDQEHLLRLSTALASQHDVQQILYIVATRLAEMIQIERVSFVIVSRDLEHGYVLAASEDPGARNIRVSLDNYPEILEVVRSRRHLVISDVASHPLMSDVKEAIARTETRSLVLFPLVVGDEVLGVLFLRAHSRWHQLSQREEHVCGIVANATAVALKNAQIVQTFRGETQKIRLARIEAERRVRALRRYEEFCENVPQGMATVDLEGKLLFLNREGERILGISRENATGTLLADLIAPAHREHIATVVEGIGVGRAAGPLDLDVIRSDGSHAILSMSVSALLSEHGAGMISFHDVTEERDLQDDLRKTKDFLEGLVRQSVDAIIAADMRGRIVLWNTAAERLFGYSSSEVDDVGIEQLFPPGDFDILLRLIQSAERGGVGRLSAVRREALNRSGERVSVRMSAALVRDGEQQGAVFAILSDLRAHEEMQARLEQAQEKLAASEQQAVVAEVAGTAAHELNQPLTSLLGLAEVLRRDLDEEHPLLSIVESVMREAERIAEIVRKLGSVTRYETKEYVGSTKIVDLDRSSDDG